MTKESRDGQGPGFEGPCDVTDCHYWDKAELENCSRPVGLAAFQASTCPIRYEATIRRLRRWVGDLHSGMYINCVYCGHRYGPSDQVPATMAEVLKEHVEKCPEHPMAQQRKALVQCALVLRQWHGPVVFDIYYKHSPELRLVRETVPWEEIAARIQKEERER